MALKVYPIIGGNMKTKQYLIPQPVAQAILDYLQNRPFAEVHTLISALMSSATHECPANDPVAAPKPPDAASAATDSGPRKEPSRRLAVRGL
jgi:hypothetical protein